MNKVSRNRKEEQIKVKLSSIIQRSSSNPKFDNVTIVDVKLSPDSSSAMIHYSVYNPSIDVVEVTNALNSAGGFFQAKLSKTLRSRNTPRLTFVFDKGFDHANKIDRLLSQINLSSDPQE